VVCLFIHDGLPVSSHRQKVLWNHEAQPKICLFYNSNKKGGEKGNKRRAKLKELVVQARASRARAITQYRACGIPSYLPIRKRNSPQLL
jgi:hypothetical protein